jgi:hypothetical protein
MRLTTAWHLERDWGHGKFRWAATRSVELTTERTLQNYCQRSAEGLHSAVNI